MMRSVVLSLAVLVLGTGCRSFPLSLYVDDVVLDELERTSYVDEVDDEAIARGLTDAFGCAGMRVPLHVETYHRVDLDPVVPFPLDEANDAAGAHLAGLRTGDVILGKNWKAQSLATTLSFEEFTYYDHLGMLVLEEGTAWVYEAWPRLELKIITGKFIERFRGEVRRTPLSEFLVRYETIVLVRLPDEGRRDRVVAAARRTITEDIPYDPYHDPARPGLSCSEYLELLLVDEGGYPDTLPDLPIGYNDSLRRLAHSLGFTTPAYVVPDAILDMDGARPVGILTQHESEAEVRAIHEAYVVLHGRSHPASPAGDYLRAHRWDFLVYRNTTLAFLEWAKGWARRHPAVTDEQMRAVFEVLHDLCFRPTSDA